MKIGPSSGNPHPAIVAEASAWFIEFRAGETIHTENSYKYSLESFAALARGSGWTPAAVWTDASGRLRPSSTGYAGNFSIHALVNEGGADSE